VTAKSLRGYILSRDPTGSTDAGYICVYCTNILERLFYVFIFEISFATSLWSRWGVDTAHLKPECKFHYVYRGVMVDGMIPERWGKGA
jgi:hypothetical protein